MTPTVELCRIRPGPCAAGRCPASRSTGPCGRKRRPSGPDSEKSTRTPVRPGAANSDACLAVSDMEGEQLFLTGLQMGLELGGLDCLPGD